MRKRRWWCRSLLGFQSEGESQNGGESQCGDEWENVGVAGGDGVPGVSEGGGGALVVEELLELGVRLSGGNAVRCPHSRAVHGNGSGGMLLEDVEGKLRGRALGEQE